MTSLPQGLHAVDVRVLLRLGDKPPAEICHFATTDRDPATGRAMLARALRAAADEIEGTAPPTVDPHSCGRCWPCPECGETHRIPRPTGDTTL